jgi:hypothetical protein
LPSALSSGSMVGLMPETNHGHHRSEDHIPPYDPPREHPERERRILGFRPLHVVVGALILVGILLIYLLLIARAGY